MAINRELLEDHTEHVCKPRGHANHENSADLLRCLMEYLAST